MRPGSDVFIYCQHKYISSFGGQRYMMVNRMKNDTRRISIYNIVEYKHYRIQCLSDDYHSNSITVVSRGKTCQHMVPSYHAVDVGII